MRAARAREPTQRTHIWSSSVNHCACVLTLPTRLETSTAERRRVSGTTAARSVTRWSAAAQALAASAGGVTAARSIRRSSFASQIRERL